MSRGTDPGRDVLAERIGDLGSRVDAVEARAEAADRDFDAMRSKVGDAQTTARLVLARLDDFSTLRAESIANGKTLAVVKSRTNALTAIVGAVALAMLAAVAKYLVG